MIAVMKDCDVVTSLDYNILELMEFCTEYLKNSVSVENATEIIISAHLTNQKDLFEIASDFVKKNEGNLVKTTAWEEFKKANPTMVIDIFSSILKL